MGRDRWKVHLSMKGHIARIACICDPIFGGIASLRFAYLWFLLMQSITMQKSHYCIFIFRKPANRDSASAIGGSPATQD